MPPAFSVLSTTVALYLGTKGSSIREQQVVRKFLVQKLSLIPIGKPSKGPFIYYVSTFFNPPQNFHEFFEQLFLSMY